MTSNATDLDEAYRTRPGTPMIGPYSVAQMDDFYAALAVGEVKPTGIMNLLQRLYIAQRCHDRDRVVDVCCGRGLQLPVLQRCCPQLGGYDGIDVCLDNLAEARLRVDRKPPPFAVAFHLGDAAESWPVQGPFDVAIYTSALEHLPREQGYASLRHVVASLTAGGRLFLSTPITPGDAPRRLQHRVHVYEWGHRELFDALGELGLVVEEVVGILPPPDPDATVEAVHERFGTGGVALYQELERHAPAALLGPVVATALDDAASEALYVCTKRAAG